MTRTVVFAREQLRAPFTLALLGAGSPTVDWVKLAVVTIGALMAAFVVFVVSARSRA